MDFKEKIRLDLRKQGYDSFGDNIIDDLFIFMHEKLNKGTMYQIEDFNQKLSFENFYNLDEENQRIIAENYMVDLNYGEKANGSLRLRTRFLNGDLIIPRGTIFTYESVQYISRQEVLVSDTELANNRDRGFYYIDVNIESNGIGDEFDIYDTVIFASLNEEVNSYFDSIINPHPIIGGSNEENSRDLYNRIKRNMTSRNLSNEPSISTVLRERSNFPQIKEVRVINAGSDQMERDKVVINNQIHRVGNKSDVYIYSGSLEEKEVIIELGLEKEINLGFSEPFIPDDLDNNYVSEDENGVPIKDVVMEVISVTGDKSNSENSFQYHQEKGYENSVRQRGSLNINGVTGNKYKIKYSYAPLIPLVQNFIQDPENRMPVGDPLAKNFKVYRLGGIIEYRGDFGESNPEYILQEITKYLENYDYNPLRNSLRYEKFFEVSDLINFMYTLGVQKVKIPTDLYLKNQANQKEVIKKAKIEGEKIVCNFVGGAFLKKENVTSVRIKTIEVIEEEIEVSIAEEESEVSIKISDKPFDFIEVRSSFGSIVTAGITINKTNGSITFENEQTYKIFYTYLLEEGTDYNLNEEESKIVFLNNSASEENRIYEIDYEYDSYQLKDEFILESFSVISVGELIVVEEEDL